MQPLVRCPWNSFTFVGELCSFSAPGAPDSDYQFKWLTHTKQTLNKKNINNIIVWKKKCYTMLDRFSNSVTRKLNSCGTYNIIMAACLISNMMKSSPKMLLDNCCSWLTVMFFLCETANKAVNFVEFFDCHLWIT